MSLPQSLSLSPSLCFLSDTASSSSSSDSTDGDPAFFRPVCAAVHGGGRSLADSGRWTHLLSPGDPSPAAHTHAAVLAAHQPGEWTHTYTLRRVQMSPCAQAGTHTHTRLEEKVQNSLLKSSHYSQMYVDTHRHEHSSTHHQCCWWAVLTPWSSLVSYRWPAPSVGENP